MDELSAAATSDATASKRSLRFADLIDLYTRPRKFFGGKLDLADKRVLVPAAWAMGITAQFDRIDLEILRREMDPDRPAWKILEPIVTGGWVGFWLWSLAIGCFSAVLIYYLAGWWYRMRLKLSGGKDLDVHTPRHLYTYSTLVVVLPQLLITLYFTFAYPNYLAAFESDELVSVLLVFVVFWSVAVSYIGATTTFKLNKWLARLWFLILPVIFNLVVMGGVVWLLTLFQ